jgi:Na+/H+-dicarboxylate symporter
MTGKPRRRAPPLHVQILIGMVVGVLFGLLFGPRSRWLERDLVRLLATDVAVRAAPSTDAAKVAAAGGTTLFARGPTVERDGQTWLRVTWTLKERQVLKLVAEDVAPSELADGSVPDKWRVGQEVAGFLPDDETILQGVSSVGSRLQAWVSPLGKLFLRLIKMAIVPLIFFSLITGVASMGGDLRRLGRLGVRIVAFFTCTTIAATTIGLTVANIARPGELLSEADRARLERQFDRGARQRSAGAAESKPFAEHLIELVPTNPVRAAADGEMLQIIVFSLLLGVAIATLPAGTREPLAQTFSGLNDAVVKLVDICMRTAPVGVAALMAEAVSSTGLSVLIAMLGYCVVVLAGLLLHVALVYLPALKLLAGRPILPTLRGIREAQLMGFSTSSSSATLPVTMRSLRGLGVSREVTGFVLPLGATINMDGTALYQGVAALFIAQVFGLHLGLPEQVAIVVTATLASVGAAGVPGAGIVTLALVLTSVGVPTAGIALILGVDRLLDMFRTTVNITGDATATLYAHAVEERAAARG